MTTPTPVTARALALLANGRTIAETEKETGLPAGAVRALVNGQRGWLVGEDGRVYDPNQPGGKVKLPEGAQGTQDKPGRRAAPPGGSVDELLAQAAELDDKTAQTLLKKTNDQLAKLRARVDEVRAWQEAEAQRAADLAAAERKIQELQAQLAEARARVKELGGKPSRPRSSAGPGRDWAAIREWARANGIDVPSRGRVPAAVVAKYDAAHGRA